MPDWVGIGGLVSAVASGLVSAWVLYRSTRVGELERVCDRQERHILQLHAAVAAQQAQLDICHEDRVEGREEVAELRGWLRTFRDGWAREAQRCGGDPAGVPDLPPPRRPPEDVERLEFLRRTQAQTALLLQEVDPTSPRRGGS